MIGLSQHKIPKCFKCKPDHMSLRRHCRHRLQCPARVRTTDATRWLSWSLATWPLHCWISFSSIFDGERAFAAHCSVSSTVQSFATIPSSAPRWIPSTALTVRALQLSDALFHCFRRAASKHAGPHNCNHQLHLALTVQPHSYE